MNRVIISVQSQKEGLGPTGGRGLGVWGQWSLRDAKPVLANADKNVNSG